MPRKSKKQAWTPNQIVAFNVNRARSMRGWTQEQAAEALAPYLGARLSAASFSALERSVAGGRIREVSADELLALSRAFDVPIGWFLTPPPVSEDVLLATPDAKDGTDPMVLIDAVLGTEENFELWESVLLSYPAGSGHRARRGSDGSWEDLGREVEDVHQRLGPLARARARLLLRNEFGDVREARQVLERLAEILSTLDDDNEPDPGQQRPARGGTKQ